MTIYGCGCIDEFLIKPSNFFCSALIWYHSNANKGIVCKTANN